MVRNILGFVIGFVVMSAGVFVAFGITMIALGPERIFMPGSWSESMLFIALTAGLAFIAAIAGGTACQFVARRRAPALALAGLVLLGGLGMAVGGLFAEKPEAPPRPEPTTDADIESAREQGWIREPTWLTFVNPFIGAAGVLLGAVIVPARRRDAPIRTIPEVEGETSEAERKAPGE